MRLDTGHPDTIAFVMVQMIAWDISPTVLVTEALERGGESAIRGIAETPDAKLSEAFRAMWDPNLWTRTFAQVPEEKLNQWLTTLHQACKEANKPC